MKKLPLWAAVLSCFLLHASRLPIRTYTTAEGLSRFDGYRFANYGTEQGLPSNFISDFIETPSGDYWVATGGGLCRFDPVGSGQSRFHCLPTTGDGGIPPPLALYRDRDGNLWSGVSGGVFKRAANDSQFKRVDLRDVRSDSGFEALLVDRHGTLWAGSSNGLYRRDPDGAERRYTSADGLPNDYIMALVEDRAGHLWIGTRAGLVRLDQSMAPGPSLKPRFTVYSVKDGLPAPRIESLLESSGGTLWVGTNECIAEHVASSPGDPREFRSFTLAQGLSARSVGALAEDRDGNLWIGTFGSGAMKVAHSGFLIYSEADGLDFVRSLVQSRDGTLCAFIRRGSRLHMARFDGRRFFPVEPGWPKGISDYGWGWGQIALQDENSEWWIATGEGLLRFPPVARVDDLVGKPPQAIYTTHDGLPGNGIFRIYEDSHRDIWIGTIGLNHQDGLARWCRSTGKVTTFSQDSGLPGDPAPTAFAEDRGGNVWIGLFHGGLARYCRSTGRFTTFTANQMHGGVRTLMTDSAGRLWIGASCGLAHVDDPVSEPPRLIWQSSAEGLSSNYIAALTEDNRGRIYAATGRGVDRFEPGAGGAGAMRHYTTADGIPPGELELAVRDRHGLVWFGTPLGAARPPPPVLLTALNVGGIPHPISDLGESGITGLRLKQTPVRVDFVGIDYSPGETLRYQYRLEGTDLAWSPPTDQRSVVYANLASGSYHFLVRAVASDGAVSPQPASLSFTILPPLWRSWWFLTACALATLLIAVGLHRYRLAQLLAVANVRTRIATDLHDDIGASLSQIAILSEVAQRTGTVDEPARIPLAEIAGISRELIDSMSDIVWAINPVHDSLGNLVYRMRRFATDMLVTRQIVLHFRSTITDHDLRVGANARRELYLIFKEAIHNILRHSGAGQVEVDLHRVDGALTLSVSDNGKGFDPAVVCKGRGLTHMRKRATALGGKLSLEAAPDRGACIRLVAPIDSRKPWQR